MVEAVGAPVGEAVGEAVGVTVGAADGAHVEAAVGENRVGPNVRPVEKAFVGTKPTRQPILVYT